MSSQGTLAVLGDALGVLYDVAKLRAKEPILNALAAEMALILAPIGMDIRAAHVWTQRNRICDTLSRLQQGSGPSRLTSGPQNVLRELPELSEAHRVLRQRPEGAILRSLKTV